MDATQKLHLHIDELLEAIRLLLLYKFYTPSLILIYSLIDIMAWLNLPDEQDNVTQSDFIQWSEKYLQPETSINCSSKDLYGARCGMVHSFNAESRLSRDFKARKIVYAFEGAETEFLQQKIRSFNDEKDKNTIVIHLELLMGQLLIGINHFLKEKDQDEVVLKKANKFLSKRATSSFN